MLWYFWCSYALTKGQYCRYSSHLYRSTLPIAGKSWWLWSPRCSPQTVSIKAPKHNCKQKSSAVSRKLPTVSKRAASLFNLEICRKVPVAHDKPQLEILYLRYRPLVYFFEMLAVAHLWHARLVCEEMFSLAKACNVTQNCTRIRVLVSRGRYELPAILRLTPPKSRAASVFFCGRRFAKNPRFLQRNGCEPACGHRGHCDFTMRFVCI